jgi:hypothetical protein
MTQPPLYRAAVFCMPAALNKGLCVGKQKGIALRNGGD